MIDTAMTEIGTQPGVPADAGPAEAQVSINSAGLVVSYHGVLATVPIGG